MHGLVNDWALNELLKHHLHIVFLILLKVKFEQPWYLPLLLVSKCQRILDDIIFYTTRSFPRVQMFDDK